MKKPQSDIIDMINDFGGIDLFKQRIRCLRQFSTIEEIKMLENIVAYYDLIFKVDIDVVHDVMTYPELFKENQKYFNRMSEKYPFCEITKFYLELIDFKKSLVQNVVRMAV